MIAFWGSQWGGGLHPQTPVLQGASFKKSPFAQDSSMILGVALLPPPSAHDPPLWEPLDKGICILVKCMLVIGIPEHLCLFFYPPVIGQQTVGLPTSTGEGTGGVKLPRPLHNKGGAWGSHAPHSV